MNTLIAFASFPILAALAPSGADVPLLTAGEQAQRASAHYALVECELRSADSAHLTAAQRAGRQHLIDALQAYRERGDFGQNRVSPGARLPVFVDDEGRRCAVAELLHVSGEDDFVEAVRARANHAWILDLAGDAHFEGWLERHGLGFDEAARIQVPSIDNNPGEMGQGAAGGSYGGPGDTVGPAAPSTGAPVAGGGGQSSPTGSPGSGPRAGGSSAPGQGPGPNPAPTTVSMTTTSDDGWWLWWEHAKLEFLVPNRLSLLNTPVTGDDGAGALREAVERARRAKLPELIAASTSAEAPVRGAAAIALGQIAGSAAVEPLLRLLADPSQEVRHRALLALGATGTSEAVATLLCVSRKGVAREGGPSISPYARSIAMIGLALAKRAGFPEPLDVAVASVVRDRPKDEREGVALAAMFHHVLAPGEALERLALELAVDEHESPSVRCRAVEALSTTRDPKVLSKLQHVLSGPRLDLRRSAALALGIARAPETLAALQTAHELEAEPMTRGLILIAIGRTGGARAHAFLTKVLADGESGQRRWAALGLGILARGTNDPETARSLRAALEREKNADGRAAYWLASGLVRDERAIEPLVTELSKAADARQRMYAATALALIGGERASSSLRERLASESNALARVGVAQALGILGDPRDVAPMRAAIDRLAEPGLQGVAATALAFHGSSDALAALGEMSTSREGTRVRRAASIEGLGLMLAHGKPLQFGELSRQVNYTVMPDWVQALFQTLL